MQTIPNADGAEDYSTYDEECPFGAPRGCQKRAKLTVPRWSISRENLQQLEGIYKEIRTPSLTPDRGGRVHCTFPGADVEYSIKHSIERTSVAPTPRP